MALEPVAGQVYFSPECHAAYAELGFSPSPGTTKTGVELPDGPAYFTSRGSLLGQVSGEVVAAAFGVFNPEAVVPSVEMGWRTVDAPTICAARTRGGVAQLARVLGPEPDGLERAVALLDRRRRAVATRRQAALRRPARPRPAGRSARRHVAAGGHAPRVPGRCTHRGVDVGRARRHRGRSPHRALLGTAHAHLRPYPRLVRRPARRGPGTPRRTRAHRRRRTDRGRPRAARVDRGRHRRAVRRDHRGARRRAPRS